MKLIEFPEQTVVIAKDQDPYLPLPAFKFPDGRIVCCWQLSWKEIVRLIFGERLIWHQVLTFNAPLQPQKLTVEKPEMR
jgi:hypothetical protein